MTYTTQPTGTGTLSDKAMLCFVNISMFNPIITDKKITSEVADQHGLKDSTMGKYQKSRIAKSALNSIKKLAGEIRQEHYRRTLPWAEDGARILTHTAYWDYAEWMRGAEAKWSPEVDKFLQAWPDHVEAARIALNGMFDEADYPTVAQLRRKFEFRRGVRPLPVADDFRVNITAEALALEKRSIQEATDAAVAAAMRDPFERIKDVVSKMAEKLSAYDPNNPKEAPFRDSLVGNVSDLLEVLPGLNLTGDPALYTFIADLRALTLRPAQVLRDDMFARDEVRKLAEDMLSHVNEFMS